MSRFRCRLESPITNCLAAARAADPSSTTWIIRTRKSFEYPIASLLTLRRPESYSRLFVNPFDSQKMENAVNLEIDGIAQRSNAAGRRRRYRA
jgi:hypothetical protein